MSQYSHFSEPDPEFAAILAGMSAQEHPKVDIQTYRNIFNQDVITRAKATWGPRLPPGLLYVLCSASPTHFDVDSQYRVTDCEIPADGTNITVRTFVPTPKDAEDSGFPLLYWMHFGGWSVGNIEMEDLFLRIVCVELQISIVNVEYRLAPEHKFPTSINDAYAGLKWTVENAFQLSASLSKGFIVGGASAGAQMTAVLTARAQDDPFLVNKITGQLLQCPCLIHPDAYPEEYKSELLSLEQNATAWGMNKELVHELYNVWGAPPNDPECSPILYQSRQGLPPAYLQICGQDPFRDEGLLYERLLNKSGAQTKLDVYPGLPHLFHFWFPNIKQAAKLEQDFKAGVRWLLQN